MSKSNKNKQKILCNICTKNIRGNAKAICCDFCDNWVHIRCNSISPSRYLELCEEDNHENFLCIKCFNNELPFGLESTFNQISTLGLSNSNLEDLNVIISKKDSRGCTCAFLPILSGQISNAMFLSVNISLNKKVHCKSRIT